MSKVIATLSDQEMVDWANAAVERERELTKRIAELEAHCNALQNKCATRGLSPEDSDALMAENDRLTAVYEAAKKYEKMFARSRTKPYSVSNELQALFEALREKDDE